MTVPSPYTAFGLVISSEIPLRLHQSRSERVDLRICRAAAGRRRPAAGWVEVRSQIGVASVSPAGDQVELDLSAAAARSEVESFLLGMVMLQVLSLRRTLCLHGGAALAPGGSIGFVAPSGAGKSTLIAALMRRGLALMADDLLPLGITGQRVSAIPTYPTLRLWDQSLRFLDLEPEVGEPAPGYDRKFVVSDVACLGHFHGEVAPLRRLYFLRRADAGEGPLPLVERLLPLAAFQELAANRLCPQIETPAVRRQGFDLLAAVSRGVPCFGLSFSRSAAALPATVDAILDPAPSFAGVGPASASRP